MRVRLLPDSPLGWTPYAWLVYLSFYVAYAVARVRSPVEWALHGAALVTFLVLYFRAFWLRGSSLVVIAFAIVGVGVIMAPLNPGASAFFIYGSAFLGDAVRPRIAFRWLFLIVAILGIETYLLDLSPQTWIPGVVFSLIIGGTNIHFGEVRRKDEALAAANEAARHMAAVAERERIARDLHDLLGHTLSVIVIKAELAAKLSERDPARAAAEIRDVERISRNALQEVRQAIRGYRGESLAQELATARTALAAAGVTLIERVGSVNLESAVEHALALAVREALTNVIRHAHATRCEVVAEDHGATATVVVHDDGVGGAAPEGSGLSGMRTRLEQVGGTLERDGSRGTRLVMRVPLRVPAPASQMVCS